MKMIEDRIDELATRMDALERRRAAEEALTALEGRDRAHVSAERTRRRHGPHKLTGAKVMTIQERWDATFSKLDRSCPAQRADEAQVDYLRRLSRIGRRYIPKGEQMASVNFAELPDNVVGKYSELMRQCVERNIMRTDNMAPGELRAVMITDENTGAKHRCWVGKDSFVKAMMQPCRRVVGGLFQRDVPRLQQQQANSIPASETRFATFGNSRGHWRFY
jgi:hypothetical protein